MLHSWKGMRRQARSLDDLEAPWCYLTAFHCDGPANFMKMKFEYFAGGPLAACVAAFSL